LTKLIKKDEKIHITRSMGSKIEFLDVSIENNQGRLRTTVHHKPAAEPYIVPFASDHPRHVHRNSIIGALCRAIRLCSNVGDFDEERLNLETMLLLNGYPPQFVSYHMRGFLQRDNASMLLQELESALYDALHLRLIRQPTRRERMLKHETQQDYNHGHSDRRQMSTSITFERANMKMLKDELSKSWLQHYQYPGSPMNGIHLRLHIKPHLTLNKLLIRKKPRPQILRCNHEISPK
jgi:hypothetical protein